MPLYEITEAGFNRHAPAVFADLGLYERGDLQRLIREDIAVLNEGSQDEPELLVISEEFGRWEDARRRIDLLAIDKLGRLVVIELKRTDSGGHMELQALRYAAMVSSMDFDSVVETFAGHLAKVRPGDDSDARSELEAFLSNEEVETDDDTPLISSEVRIILVSADFGRELTTAVMWLNRFEGMDIRCVRLVPYSVEDRTLIDVQQVIPLPQAAEYQVKLRRKEQRRERVRSDRRDFTRYHVVVDGQVLPDENKRQAVRTMVTKLLDKGIRADAVGQVLGPVRFRPINGVPGSSDELVREFRAAYPRFDDRRWFLDHPFTDEGQTWLLRNQWGRNTEPTLEALRDAFPESGVTFQRAQNE